MLFLRVFIRVLLAQSVQSKLAKTQRNHYLRYTLDVK
nr:MAG TPA: hypothetical protein [Caudoviricetes sp.]